MREALAEVPDSEPNDGVESATFDFTDHRAQFRVAKGIRRKDDFSWRGELDLLELRLERLSVDRRRPQTPESRAESTGLIASVRDRKRLPLEVVHQGQRIDRPSANATQTTIVHLGPVLALER